MTRSFSDDLNTRVILFDGAMGTEIQKLSPQARDFPGEKEGFNDGLTLTRPEWIQTIHRKYLKAGADCIETNSFGSNFFKLQEYGYGEQTIDLNVRAARLARAVCSEFRDRPRYVIGTMGPSGYLPSSNDPDLGSKTPDEIKNAYIPQAIGLIHGGIDALLVETSQDILEVKIAIEACQEAMESLSRKVPIIANVTLDQYGKMLLGTPVQAAYTTVSHMEIDVFGLNCSTGPAEMLPSVRWLNEQEDLPLLVVPNAGMPQNEGGKAIYKMTPIEMSKILEEFIHKFDRVRIIGGCCGTNEDHIYELRNMLDRNHK
ncbi:MAG: homocysteine S-methyltransferase family protein [Thermoproteota archaeon]|nr:homocysteine S-methyltransferase family protein [Thermoproteota archaeon]